MGNTASGRQTKIFVLNLDRATDRMAHMDALLKSLNLEYERIPAIDGSKLTEQEIKANYSPFWFGLFHGRQISRGELGCAMSHRLAYQRIVAEQLPEALICEDDIELAAELPRILNKISEAAKDFDVVQLYFSRTKTPKTIKIADLENFELHRFQGTHASAIAYLTRQSAAKRFLRSTRVVLTADKFSWFAALFGIRFCTVQPFLAVPNTSLNESSNIDQSDAISNNAGRINQRNFLWKYTLRPLMISARVGLSKVRRL
jgi:GR25 family glycosyltransferase involved in LPS biosynthesis